MSALSAWINLRMVRLQNQCGPAGEGEALELVAVQQPLEATGQQG